MRKVIIGTLAATLIGGSLTGVAFAKSAADGSATGPDKGPARWSQELQLTPEQQVQMLKLRDRQQEGRVAMRNAFREEMAQMQVLDPKAKDFQAQVDKLMKQAQQRAAERVKAQAEMKSKMAEILTPEQFSKMQAMIGKRMGRHGDFGSGRDRGHRDGHRRDDHKMDGYRHDHGGRGGDACRG